MNGKIKEFNSAGVKFLSKIQCDGDNDKYLCECPLCHKPFVMWASHYYRGTNSCKCKHVATHNKRLYSIWVNMKTRCYNKNSPSYKHYGEKGIKICNEWLNNFEPFFEWASNNGYEDNLTIDRVDYNGDYCPENCRWVTVEEQARNKSNNIVFTINGEQKVFRQICIENNIGYKTEYSYYKRHGYEKEYERLLTKIQ